MLHRSPSEDRQSSQLRLDLDQPIVLGDALAAARRTGLDLAAIGIAAVATLEAGFGGVLEGEERESPIVPVSQAGVSRNPASSNSSSFKAIAISVCRLSVFETSRSIVDDSFSMNSSACPARSSIEALTASAH